jgi:hypothetical protein
MNEEWRQVPSFPNYYVSDLGRVRGARGWVLSPSKAKKIGYLRVKACRNGRIHLCQVNRLVCEAFHGPAPSTHHQAAHWDNDPSNNKPGNLRWATSLENCHDRKHNGVWQSLSNHPRAQFIEEDIVAIRRVYAENKPGKYVRRGTLAELANRYGVKVSAIKDIVQRRSWGAVA